MDIKREVIVVREAQDKGQNIKIVDGQKRKFTLWKVGRQGTNQAFVSYQNTQGVGATVEVEFGEKPASFVDQKGQTVNYTERTIYGLKPSDGSPSPVQAQKPLSEANLKPQTPSSEPKDEVFWDKKAYKQCLWGYFLEVKKGVHLTQTDMDMVWTNFTAIEKDADSRFNPEPEMVEQSDNVTGEDIPF